VAQQTSCSIDADCPAPAVPCTQCANDIFACPIVSCVNGQCFYQFPRCESSCTSGLEWCPLNGSCVHPACLSCCQFGAVCSAAADCGDACVKCANGSTACRSGQCGTTQAGQCSYPEPLCATLVAPVPVPAATGWIGLGSAGLLGWVGIALLRGRRRLIPSPR
jgi:hypothetical protein